MIYFDGHFYNSESDLPELHSLVCVSHSSDETRRDYMGLSTDASYLPEYSDLATGSTFLATDKVEYWVFTAGQGTGNGWKKVVG